MPPRTGKQAATVAKAREAHAEKRLLWTLGQQ